MLHHEITGLAWNCSKAFAKKSDTFAREGAATMRWITVADLAFQMRQAARNAQNERARLAWNRRAMAQQNGIYIRRADYDKRKRALAIATACKRYGRADRISGNCTWNLPRNIGDYPQSYSHPKIHFGEEEA